MSTRHLERLLQPASVAVIGASDRPQSLGATVMRNLLAADFRGPIWPVNPKHAVVAGVPVFARVADLPQAPDLAVICTPARTIPGLVAELGDKGTRAALVLSAGLSAAAGDAGLRLKQAMLDAARPHVLRILGPNCVGLLTPSIGLNASFAPTDALTGPLAFVSQSGALTTALLDWARSRHIGFSQVISLGDGADVDFGDLLAYLADDARTRAILLYIESVKAAPKFLAAARAAALRKPVVLLKAGRAPEGSRAAASHTGAMTGSDAVFDAAVRQTGMLRVPTLAELFIAAEMLARGGALHGERLCIMTNGGGAGVLAADQLAVNGGRLAKLAPESLESLGASLPATWSPGNPVDIIGDAPVERYLSTLRVLLADPGIDALLFMHAPTAIVPSAEIARACLPLLQDARIPVLGCWLGGEAVAEARQLFTGGGIATYETPEQAIAAFLQQVARLRITDGRSPGTGDVAAVADPDRETVRRILAQARAEGRALLNELEAKALLEAYRIPTVTTRVAADAGQAVVLAGQIGYPVAVKILSPDVTHKSDVGGVALDLMNASDVRDAALAMQQRLRERRPDARLAGFTVQAMVRRPGAHELIVGSATDPQFGPVILFGQGGVAVEVIRDRAIALPPLDASLADDLVARTRVAALLAGYRNRPAIDHAALRRVLLQVSQLVTDFRQIAELDVNPLLADDVGMLALDARVRLVTGKE